MLPEQVSQFVELNDADWFSLNPATGLVGYVPGCNNDGRRGTARNHCTE